MVRSIAAVWTAGASFGCSPPAFTPTIPSQRSHPPTPPLEIPAGESVTATIWGDDILNGEDFPTCSESPCLLVYIDSPTDGRLMAHLTWSGSINELGVEIMSGGNGLQLFGPDDYGASPLEVASPVRSGLTLVAIKLLKAGGSRVIPVQASQMFQLNTRFTVTGGS